MVRGRKLNGSSIIETIVAVLILLLSFAAGISLYSQVMLSTYSDVKLRASLEQGFVADSLISAGVFEDQVLQRGELHFELGYKPVERYPGLLLMQLQCYDLSGTKLSELRRMIRRDDGQ
ncbi:hypothetical protein HDC92_004647 [Pedobacter sp. AK017]|uniref:hypothetical protein n=1 Tax=Pedobacter sp. AK017 TaxID=2723073 RepID=UPI00160846B1|nr:hypothetical protein [Pedobacter sp. AK017]MBB5440943.1 hypothetical protein [Pedobacter sp. AK017]